MTEIPMENSPSSSQQNLPLVPTDVWIQLLLNVDDSTLKTCYLANKTFHSILSSQNFWLRRCIKYQVDCPNPDISYSVDYRLIYFKKPYGRNLIKNPNGRLNQSGTFHLFTHLPSFSWNELSTQILPSIRKFGETEAIDLRSKIQPNNRIRFVS